MTTYINSGNVIFDSDLDESTVKVDCEMLIESGFGFKITVGIILSSKRASGILLMVLKTSSLTWTAKNNRALVTGKQLLKTKGI